LGEDYAKQLRNIFEGRVPGGADLVCYWFEKAHAALSRKAEHVGLVATNSIRGGRNRVVLERIKANGDIYEAWSDEAWVLDGAAVRVSLVCFSNRHDVPDRYLDGQRVKTINADLSSNASDLTQALTLS